MVLDSVVSKSITWLTNLLLTSIWKRSHIYTERLDKHGLFTSSVVDGNIYGCSYCGKDFAVLGWHPWRCTKRMPNNVGSTNTRDFMTDDDVEQGNGANVIKCSCGKMCKGVKGLKIHQRCCRVVEGLSEDQVAVGSSNIGTDHRVNRTRALTG